jgi:ATP-dependent DNA ligase
METNAPGSSARAAMPRLSDTAGTGIPSRFHSPLSRSQRQSRDIFLGVHLPEPMVSKPGALPARRGWASGPKWDGYRALIRSGDHYCVVAGPAGHDGTPAGVLVLPVEGVFDGELVAFGDDGLPSFHGLSLRILHSEKAIPVALILLDVAATCSRSKASRDARALQGTARDPRATESQARLAHLSGLRR